MKWLTLFTMPIFTNKDDSEALIPYPIQFDAAVPGEDVTVVQHFEKTEEGTFVPTGMRIYKNKVFRTFNE